MKPRRTCIGINSSHLIEPGSVGSIIISPLILFRPDQFMIPDEIARLFFVESFTIGQETQFASTDGIHGIFFTRPYIHQQPKYSTIQVGQTTIITVRNLALRAGHFNGMLVGITIADESEQSMY